MEFVARIGMTSWSPDYFKMHSDPTEVVSPRLVVLVLQDEPDGQVKYRGKIYPGEQPAMFLSLRIIGVADSMAAWLFAMPPPAFT